MPNPNPEELCQRCGRPRSAHAFHPIKNPNEAGIEQGSRCKGFVSHEERKARELPRKELK